MHGPNFLREPGPWRGSLARVKTAPRLLWAVATLGLVAAVVNVIARVVLTHTHQRALGGVTVSVMAALVAFGLARFATRLGRSSLPLGAAVLCACAGATYLGVLLSSAF